MNILILSSGTRNKIVEYFKKENKNGKVFAADSSKLAPSLYIADEYFIIPRVDNPEYLEKVLMICKKNDIDAILSLIDPELSIISENHQKFIEIGTTPIVSEYDVIKMSFDKFKFINFLEDNGFNSIKSYVSKDLFFKDLKDNSISFPVFIKPVTGSASLNINKVNSINEVNLLFNNNDNLIIQEFMDGKEYGVDVYIDLISGEPVSIFIKEKLKMRAGETDKSISVKNEQIFDLVENFVKKFGYKGIIDIDIFEVSGEYYISEVNPRFGGGYPHAHEAGVNIPKMIINNIKGISNNINIGDYKEETYMMKYNDLKYLNA